MRAFCFLDVTLQERPTQYIFSASNGIMNKSGTTGRAGDTEPLSLTPATPEPE